MAYSLFKRLMTSLYSSLFLFWDLVEPVGLPSLPPFKIYCFLPEFSRNEMLSRYKWAQVETGRYYDYGKHRWLAILVQKCKVFLLDIEVGDID